MPARGVALLVTASLGASWSVGTPAQAAPPAVVSSGAAPVDTVTLLTGDQVLLPSAGGQPRVRPGFGREGMRFLTYRRGGDLFVVPQDAAPLVSAGTLDRQLFDITGLVAQHYDDGSRDSLPLILQEDGARQVGGSKIPIGTTPTVELPSINAIAVTEGKRAASHSWSQLFAQLRGDGHDRAAAPPFTRIWLDARVHANLDQSVPQIGAPAAWARGLTGRDVTVAVLDTGIDQTHPDLADAVSEAADFTGSESGTRDVSGHGTHVASIITGSGAALRDRRYQGVAPDVRLAVGKVLDDDGFGTTSQIIAGMEWAAPRAKVINMSLGSLVSTSGPQPMDLAVDRLSRQTGALFVVSAGNSGPSADSISSPGSADAALTVGAVDKQDRLAAFSSRGPRTGDGSLKPDITAPGVDIVAARAEGSTLGAIVGDGFYQRLSGTSMAAPHVAGAAAILAGQHPDWTGDQLKAALMGSAHANDGQTVYEQGAGRVDVARAVSQGVYAVPPSVNAGTQRWPHADDELVRTTLAYHNDTDTPVTLMLSVDVRGPDGRPAPRGMFDVSDPRLTVPAHSAARAAVTADTRVPAADGVYGGALVATDGRTAVRTPIGITREVESYDVTLRALDRTGAPTPEYGVEFDDLDRPAFVDPYDPSGTVVARLPKGRHMLNGFVQSLDEDAPFGLDVTEFAEPTVVVDRDSTLTLDARDGRSPGFAPDRPEARLGLFTMSAFGTVGFGLAGFGLVAPDTTGVYVVPSRTSGPGRFDFEVRGWLARPDGNGTFANSPYLYHLAWSADGRIPASLTRRVRDRDLVPVHSSFAAVSPGTGGLVDQVVDVALPARVQEFFTPGVPWFNEFWELDSPAGADVLAVQLDGGTVYAARRGVVTERWNAAPLGPAFPPDPSGVFGPSGFRIGDRIFLGLPLLTDQGGNHLSAVGLVESARTAVLRDGVLVGSSADPGSGSFAVPPGDAAYRVEADIARDTTLSTRVSATWDFRSAGFADDALHALPMMAVRFTPTLDAHNAAAAGRLLAVPVSVQRQPGAAYGKLSGLTVQVSYDDGRTWRAVRLLGRGDHRTALVGSPPDAHSVSLRAVATDSAGNRVDQTIIRAYALR